MSPSDLMERLEDRLAQVSARGVNAWRAGARLASQRLEIGQDLALEGVIETGAAFARAMAAEDPRRFRLAKAQEREQAAPVLLMLIGDAEGGDSDDPAHDDVLALTLRPGSRRFWRMTCGCDWLGELKPGADGVLRLRQDAHRWAAMTLNAAAYRRRAREEGEGAFARALAAARAASGLSQFLDARALPADDPARRAYLDGFAGALRAKAAGEERWRMLARPASGALILDPAAIDWTRRGAVGDAEQIEIVDAPADGPLGRAIRRMNPRIGTRHGVRLDGVTPQPKYQRRAAA